MLNLPKGGRATALSPLFGLRISLTAKPSRWLPRQIRGARSVRFRRGPASFGFRERASFFSWTLVVTPALGRKVVAESREQLRARFRAALHARFQAVARSFELLAVAPHDSELQRDALGELHTLKGEARMLGLSELARLAHELESRAGDGAALADWSHSLESMRRSLEESLQNRQNAALPPRASENLLEATLLELSRYAQAQAARSGKSLAVEVSALAVELPPSLLELLRPVLLHLLENAVVHGLEPPHERGAKPVTGRLALRAELRASCLLVTCEDDGRGIDLQAIRAAAVARGLFSAESVAQLSRERLFDLLFEHGFSTQPEVTQVSGRGVGLAVVRRGVQALGGELALESDEASGTRFVLSLPLAPLASGEPPR